MHKYYTLIKENIQYILCEFQKTVASVSILCYTNAISYQYFTA